MEKGKTVIFFDEVQKCPSLITAIKFLVDKGSYFYILNGAICEIELKDIASIPVGYLHTKEMYPLDFEEFITSNEITKDIIKEVEKCYNTKTSVDSFIHEKMMELYNLYLLIGGMPESVKTYLECNNIEKVREVQIDILSQYKKEIEQKDIKHKKHIEDIFSLIQKELNGKTKRFMFKDINKDFKFSRYENSFNFLKEANIAIPAFNVEKPTYPLKLSELKNLFKLFSSDVGLLSSIYSKDLDDEILKNNVNLNYGSLYENAVAQELRAHGFDLYYFCDKKQGELDFVIEHEKEILPIQVKIGKDYKRHNALKIILSDSFYNINKAIVFYNGTLKTKGVITYLPIYMTMFIHKKKNKSLIYKIDLGPLGAK